MNNTNTPTTFTVYRDSWLYGDPTGSSVLLNYKDEKGCCLGHVVHDCEVPAAYFAGAGSPYALRNDPRVPWPIRSLFMGRDDDGYTWLKPWVRNAIRVNDTEELPLKDREAKLIEIFASAGLKLTFVDGKRDW